MNRVGTIMKDQQDLVSEAQSGSREAFGRLVEEVQEPLLSSISKMLGPQLRGTVEPEDIFQDTLARAYQSAGGSVYFTADDGVHGKQLWMFQDFPNRFIRGDSNADGATDISDAVAILSYLFLGIKKVPCEQAGDPNDDGVLDISDAVYVLSFLFLGGKPIVPPVGTCGVDPTGHSLPCQSFPGCP